VKTDNQVVSYEGGEARVEVRVERESVWLSLQKLADVMIRLIENMLALPVAQED
jgi:hypothetical protein